MLKLLTSILTLPLVLAACTTPEERFANDAAKLFPPGETDYAQMCGSIGEIMYENWRGVGQKQLLVQVGGTEITQETPQSVRAHAQLYLNASGYLRTPVGIDCTFSKDRVVAERWHEITGFRINGKEVKERVLASINSTGASLAGGYQAATDPE